MVAIDTSRSVAPQMANRAISFLFNIANTVSAWNNARITRAELSKLTASELDDIGLCYGDIEEIAAGSYRR